MSEALARRGFLTRMGALGSTLVLAACGDINQSPTVMKVLDSAKNLSKWAQRLFAGFRPGDGRSKIKRLAQLAGATAQITTGLLTGDTLSVNLPTTSGVIDGTNISWSYASGLLTWTKWWQPSNRTKAFAGASILSR